MTPSQFLPNPNELAQYFQLERVLGFALLVVVLYLAYRVAVRVINRNIRDVGRRHGLRKLASYLALLLGVLLGSTTFLGKIGSLGAVLGILAAGLAIAFRDSLANIGGWLYIISRQGFRTGDRIEIQGVRGDVIDVGVFKTTLVEVGNWVGGDQSTGRLVTIPNKFVFQEPLYNYTYGFQYIWDELKFLVTFESNWERAREILLEIARADNESIRRQAEQEMKRLEQQFAFKYGDLEPIVYGVVEESGVELSLRYLVDTRQRRTVRDRISREILSRFAKEPPIQFAYPTMRVFYPDVGRFEVGDRRGSAMEASSPGERGPGRSASPGQDPFAGGADD